MHHGDADDVALLIEDGAATAARKYARSDLHSFAGVFEFPNCACLAASNFPVRTLRITDYSDRFALGGRRILQLDGRNVVTRFADLEQRQVGIRVRRHNRLYRCQLACKSFDADAAGVLDDVQVGYDALRRDEESAALELRASAIVVSRNDHYSAFELREYLVGRLLGGCDWSVSEKNGQRDQGEQVSTLVRHSTPSARTDLPSRDLSIVPSF